MTGRMPRVAIAGAGIAGLCAALAFVRLGIGVRIHERASVLEEAGAGIQLSPNATRILQQLGVLERLEATAVEPLELAIRSARTLKRIATVPLGSSAVERWHAPYLTVHRADLQAALLAAAEERAEIELVTGATVREAIFARDREIALSVEQNGGIEKADCDLVVGADGVWSTVRALCGGGESRFTGHIAWRAMVRPDAGTKPGGPLAATDRVTAFLHPGFHLVSYPVRAGKAVNLVAVAKGPETPPGWSNSTDRSLLERAMKGASPDLRELAAQAGPWNSWPIHAVDPGGPWTDPRGIALIGDAAHAMTPYAAQGAAMAIEDAATLAALVARQPEDIGKALEAYEGMRKERVRRVAARGAFNRFTWHAGGPVAIARDIVLGMRPPQRLAADLDWLYGWTLDGMPADPGEN